MNCTSIAALLNEHAQSQLTTAERCALDEHLAACEPCTLAWQAQTALLTLPIPAAPRSLLRGVLRAIDAEAVTAPRRSRTPFVLGASLLAAGATFAAVTFVTLTERTSDRSPATSTAARPATPRESAASAGAAPISGVVATGTDGVATAVELVDADYLLIVRTPPVYPPQALADGRTGSVTLQFTITETGAITDVAAVQSTDAAFEAAAILAVANWKYLPRILAGRRVPVRGVHTVIRFELAPDPPAAATTPPPVRNVPAPDDAVRYADYVALEHGIEVVWERVATEDLRGAELVLDELRATYELDAYQQGSVYDFYGYIYTLYGDYGRAIAAYETAIAAYDTPAGPRPQGRWLALANLYFARHQYDMALQTLLAYRQRLAQVPSFPGRDSETDLFIDRLRALGVTEETL
jgi:TonB family protein